MAMIVVVAISAPAATSPGDPEIGANDYRISDIGGIGNPNFDAKNADVTWNSTHNHYLVVWSADDPKDGAVDNEYEIWGQILDANLGGMYTNDFRISRMGPDGDPTYDARTPAVTYNSTENEYLVVWSGDTNTGGLIEGENEIWAQRVDWSSMLLGASLRMSDMGGTGDLTFNAYRPDVAYNSQDNEYLIVWQGDDNTGGLVDGEVEIYGQLINAIGGGLGPNDYRLSDVGGIGDSSFDAYEPAVAYNSWDKGIGICFPTPSSVPRILTPNPQREQPFETSASSLAPPPRTASGILPGTRPGNPATPIPDTPQPGTHTLESGNEFTTPLRVRIAREGPAPSVLHRAV